MNEFGSSNALLAGNSGPTNYDSTDCGPRRDRDYKIDIPGDDLQAAQCTTQDDLERRLSDSLMLNENEMRLMENCKALGLKFGTKTEKNGDCFFDAVYAQLNSPRLKACPSQCEIQEWTPKKLREDVVNHRYEKLKNSRDPAGIQDLELWCTNMKQVGTFADPRVVFETAQMLKRDIVVVTSSPSSGPHNNVFWIVGKDGFNGEPLLLGHYCNKYYQSLEPIRRSKHCDSLTGVSLRNETDIHQTGVLNNTPKMTVERIRDMKQTAIEDFSCICHDEIRLNGESDVKLEKGDQITRPVKCCCGYIHLCFHHAILEKDVPDILQNKTVKCISFAESNDGKGKIDQSTENLNYEELDIYKIEYRYPKYKGEQVVENVLKLKDMDMPYHAFLNNCEHICRGCVTGEMKSIQVDTLDECCVKSVFGCIPRLLRLALAILVTVPDDFYNPNKGWIIGIQCFALAVFSYLLLRQLLNSKFKYSQKKMCIECMQSTSRNFLLGCAFIITSVVSIILDETIRDECITYALTGIALLFWLIPELSNICSERCIRTTTRYIFFKCATCTCCRKKCYNAMCDICFSCKCQCRACSKRFKEIIVCIDKYCYRLVECVSRCLACCCSCLRSCSRSSSSD